MKAVQLGLEAFKDRIIAAFSWVTVVAYLKKQGGVISLDLNTGTGHQRLVRAAHGGSVSKEAGRGLIFRLTQTGTGHLRLVRAAHGVYLEKKSILVDQLSQPDQVISTDGPFIP